VFSKRTVTAAAVAGTAAVLLASGSAYACSIGDFTAKATCDTSTGEAKAAITVTDTDPSGTPADITVRLRMASGYDGVTLGTGHIDHFTSGEATTTILVPWMQGYQWNVSVTAGSLTDERLTDLPISPDSACVPDSASPTGTPTTTSPTSIPTTTSQAPSAPSTTPSAVAAASSTSPSPSPTTAPNQLAETGGGSSTGLITASAAAVIVAGGGVLFALRRRTAAGRH
jgi:LPXTG-motif cell wall-anchored protein